MKFRNLFLIYLVLILLLVVLPLNNGESFLSNTYVVKIRLDYLGHVLLFLPFLFLGKQAGWLKPFPVVLFGIGYAWFSEGIQYVLPYRALNINDLIANTLGIILGSIFLIPGISSLLSRFLNGGN